MIRKIVISTGAVTTLAGNTSSGSTDATGTAARFLYPTGITTDGTNLYVADRLNHKIRKIVISSGVVTTLAGSGSEGSADGTGTSASFKYPNGITNDGTNLYVADRTNHTIRKIVISSGVVTTLAGSAGSSGSTNGTGTSAKFKFPYGITSDGTNLYLADGSNYVIRKIVISTGVVTTLAGSGSSGSTDAAGTDATFNDPYGIYTDGTNLYVTENSNHKIRKIALRETETANLTLHNLDDDLNVTVNVASSNTSEATVSPATLTFAQTNWQTNQTVTLTGVDDSDSDGHQGYGISLTAEGQETDRHEVTTLAGSGSSGFCGWYWHLCNFFVSHRNHL